MSRIAFLNDEEAMELKKKAKELGFMKIDSEGNERINWDLAKNHLEEFGYIDEDGNAYLPGYFPNKFENFTREEFEEWLRSQNGTY